MSSTLDTEAQVFEQRPKQRSLCFPISISRKKRRSRGNKEKKREVAEYGDTSAAFWNLYLSEAEINDKNLIDNLVGDTNSMLIVNTLFSSIVAAFIVEMVKELQTSDKPSNIVIRMNIVMFLSLFLSMMSVVVSALIQQWCREFMKYAYPRAPPHKRGRVRTYLYQGLDQFQMKKFMYGVHVFLHISVFLFFWAVSDFLYNANQSVGTVARYSLLTSLVVYTAFSVSPLIFINSPYHTALTPLLRAGGMPILFALRILWRLLPSPQEQTCSLFRHFKGISFDRTHFLMDEANSRAKLLDPYAMGWLFTENDFSDLSMDTFLETIPGYVHSQLADKESLVKQLTPSYILERIRGHFLTCATTYGLSEEACIARVSACINFLRLISKPSGKHPSSEANKGSPKIYVPGLINDLNALCDREDPGVALRASCVRALAFQGILTHLMPADVEATPSQEFPIHLVPLYTFFSDGDNHEIIRQLDNNTPSTEVPNDPPNEEESERMWKVLLHDGPLVNLTHLSRAILSHERVHPRALSLCWKTLDTLLKEFGIAKMEVSESALAKFNEVLDKAHKRVQVDHRGFRVTPLLEILDTVARGRRLSMVFLGHPKYYGRADVVFGKEQLWNSDLMEAFASCLPGYIAKISKEERRGFMEGMVCDDELWTSLQVNLWNAVRSDSPIPDKLRIFEACCTVIDAMFLALEDSDRVDWREPHFGSLAQHFELFVTTCFQGTFIGRATGFRVGLIKLRFCKAVLAQFHREVDQEGAVSLRSQWDVAALARVFYTLEVGDDEDVRFWKTFTDGGHIAAEFMVKVREMLDLAICDGPLLNFCKLGHLAVTAVPFAGSGLESADMEKLQELQETMLKDKRLPLNRASDEVWNELFRLHGEVYDISTKSSGEEKAMLERLLGVVEKAYNLCPSGLQQPHLTQRSTHIPPHSLPDDDTSPRNLASSESQPAILNRITSRVVNQIDIVPFPVPLVHPRFTYIRDPLRRSFTLAYLPTERDDSGTLTDSGPELTSLSDPDSIFPNPSMGPLHRPPDLINAGQSTAALASVIDRKEWII